MRSQLTSEARLGENGGAGLSKRRIRKAPSPAAEESPQAVPSPQALPSGSADPRQRIHVVSYLPPRPLRSVLSGPSGTACFLPEASPGAAAPLSYQVSLGDVRGGLCRVVLGADQTVRVPVPRLCDGLPREVWADAQQRLVATFHQDGLGPGKGALGGASLGLGFGLGLGLPANGAFHLSMGDVFRILVALQVADIVARFLWWELLLEDPLKGELLLRLAELVFGLAMAVSLLRPQLAERVAKALAVPPSVRAIFRLETIKRAGVELAPVTAWPDRPVMARGRPDCTLGVTPRGATALYPAGPMAPDPISLCVNVAPSDFESPLFRGSLMVRLKGLDNSPMDYFEGRNRRMQVCIQGRFKRRTRFDKVFSGQEFPKPFAWLPSRTVVSTCFAVLTPVLPPTFKHDVFSDTPFFLSPLLCTCQGFAVERPGEEQDVFGDPAFRWAIQERTALLEDPDVPTNGDKRRKYFGIQANLEKYHFEPGLVYTFDYYQHYFDATQMNLDLSSFLRFDATRILGEQALQLSMAKDITTNEYMWNFDLLHESLVHN